MSRSPSPAASGSSSGASGSADPASDDAGLGARGGVLYVVSLPIGNVRDITLRAIDVITTADIVAAEDTRVFRDLVRRAGLAPKQQKVVSYHSYNEEGRSTWLIARLQEGSSVAVVTDAGTPGINDPGHVVIGAAIEAQVPIVCVPGASAAIAALSIAGLRTDRFHYVGFLPTRPGRRARALEEVADFSGTLIFYEAPHRLVQTLAAIAHALGNRKAAVVQNLTKSEESVRRGPLLELGAAFEQGGTVRGEFTLLVDGAEPGPPVLTPRVEALIDRWIARGADATLVRELAQDLLHMRRRDLYNRVLDARSADDAPSDDAAADDARADDAATDDGPAGARRADDD